MSLRNEAVTAASRSAAPSGASTTASVPTAAAAAGAAEREAEAPPAPWSPRGDTDGPDPALWALASGQETPGLAERLESWGRSRGGRMGGSGDDIITAGAGTNAGVGEGSGSRLDAGSAAERPEWPRRVRLRTRLGKRCRKDLAAGRAGILIKATFNPLEGDSSGAKARCLRVYFCYFVLERLCIPSTYCFFFSVCYICIYFVYFEVSCMAAWAHRNPVVHMCDRKTW